MDMKRLAAYMAMILSLLCVSVNSLAKDKLSAEEERARQQVERICLSMQQYMERPDNLKSVKLDKSPEINAYADSDNNVTFLMGMVDFVRDENELAVVCGHELAHLAAKHISRSLFTRIVSSVAADAIGGFAGDVAGTALYSKQSRKHEREADRRGLLYMWQAGYDPRAAWKFWQSLENQYEQGNASISKYFGTHPVTRERVENFKVLLVRNCHDAPALSFCDEILEDEDLLKAFNEYEERD